MGKYEKREGNVYLDKDSIAGNHELWRTVQTIQDFDEFFEYKTLIDDGVYDAALMRMKAEVTKLVRLMDKHTPFNLDEDGNPRKRAPYTEKQGDAPVTGRMVYEAEPRSERRALIASTVNSLTAVFFSRNGHYPEGQEQDEIFAYAKLIAGRLLE